MPTPRTTSEGEITTPTLQPTTTTPAEVCERVLGMDEPQLVPDRFIVVCIDTNMECDAYHNAWLEFLISSCCDHTQCNLVNLNPYSSVFHYHRYLVLVLAMKVLTAQRILVISKRSTPCTLMTALFMPCFGWYYLATQVLRLKAVLTGLLNPIFALIQISGAPFHG